MASKSKGNFIKISPHERMNYAPIAIFNITGVSEEDTTEYYPIMSNFYDTVIYRSNGTITDVNKDSVPPQALGGLMVNKITNGAIMYWLSDINDNSLIYRSIGNSAKYITISTTDDWNTYTVNKPLD